ncbi:Angio-associated migratory cell protein [Halotydeus destructor]|nr:Angio-associated migratory cell protein [Halotydeus destructor]
MKQDIPVDRSEMEEEGVYLQADDIDEEIEIIDESELAGLENDDNEDIDNANFAIGEDGDDDIDEDEDYVTENEPPEEDAKIVVTGHKEAVLSIAVKADGDIAVSGGQDDKALIWNTSTGQILHEFTGHKDSVVSVGFSCKETFVATGDMGGLIQVFKVGTFENIFTYETDDLQWMRWHPTLDTVLLCGTESGNAWMFKVNDYTQVKTFQGPGFSNTAGSFTSCGTKAMMGYDDGSLRLWDLKSGSTSATIKGNLAHTSTVTCLDIKCDDSVGASGSTDGTVKLVNLQSGKLVNTFECGKARNTVESSASEPKDRSIESVAFCPSLPLLATATVSGVIEVWDSSTFVCRTSMSNPSGISSINWNPIESSLLHVAGLDGSLITYDGRSGQQHSALYGHRDQILDFAVSKTNNILVTASEDSSCRVFEFRAKN